ETLDRAHAGLVPGCALAAVEADDGEVGGRLGDRWDARAGALRLVDGDVHEAVAAEEIERAVASLVGHPARLPELDGDRRVGQMSGERLEIRVRLPVRREPLRHLEEHVGELPRAAERPERRREAAPDLVEDAGRQLARVDVPLDAELARQLELQVRVEPRWLDRMRGETGVRLGAHREVRGRALRPSARALR